MALDAAVRLQELEARVEGRISSLVTALSRSEASNADLRRRLEGAEARASDAVSLASVASQAAARLQAERAQELDGVRGEVRSLLERHLTGREEESRRGAGSLILLSHRLWLTSPSRMPLTTNPVQGTSRLCVPLAPPRVQRLMS